MKVSFHLFLGLLLLQLGACMPPRPKPFEGNALKFSDPELLRILDFQDKRQADSLYPYLQSTDPNLRFAAARAFGSVRDPRAVPHLTPLLSDEVLEVRTAAAYALGQAGEAEALPALVNAFVRQDTARHYALFHCALLEAVGKCGDKKQLRNLATIATYLPDDTLLLEGQTRGIYRYALRGITDPAATRLMVNYVCSDEMPPSVRLMAANYLHRAKKIRLKAYTDTLIPILSDDNPYIRQCIATALGKTGRDTALQALEERFFREPDYRVRCNILRALSHFKYEKTAPFAFAALRDENANVSLCAAEYLLAHGYKTDAKRYWRFARDSLPANRTKWTLYAAAEHHLPYYFGTSHSRIKYELKTAYDVSENPYMRAAIIRALGSFYKNYREVWHLAKADPHPAVRTAGIRALGDCMRVKKFKKAFRPKPEKVEREVSDYLAEAIRSGDLGMMTEAAYLIADKKLFFRKYLADSTHLLKNALQGLELPRETETKYALEQALAYLQGKPAPQPAPPAYNHPIDWQALRRAGPKPHVLLKTTRGDIELELWPEDAPGSVINFLKLVETGFYNGKPFHRVVPNFVIQGGCPRGDGYGSLDYSIRTEVPRLYYDTEGLLGMASAGPDTECTQFFITHSPTPHLDGKYTIFGRVIKGMEAVHQMTQGDVLEKAAILNE